MKVRAPGLAERLTAQWAGNGQSNDPWDVDGGRRKAATKIVGT